MRLDAKENLQFVTHFWESEIIPTLCEYIKIPNKSPHFDKDWQKNGYMQQAVKLIAEWSKRHISADMSVEVIQLQDRTPVIFIEIPGDSKDTILLYGHLDKQPEMRGWSPDLHPWLPVLRNDRLYGRGAADDGYAVFASLAAIKSLKSQNIKHARCLILIEACEESGSYDLPFYIDALKDRIQEPKLIICLDSGCGNYDQLWLTTSLRGLAGGTLSIEVLKQGVHSGLGSGIIPSCTRILRLLLNRIENEKTGNVLLKNLHVKIPSQRKQQIKYAAKILGQSVYKDLPFEKKVKPEAKTPSELILRHTWKPALSITGCDGFPAIQDAGNVTLPSLSVKLSMRLPPTCDASKATKLLKKVLEKNTPYNAIVKFEPEEAGTGWDAPKEANWLTQSVDDASLKYFGKKAVYTGEGGSIPFMGMLGKKFPRAQFLITGVLGPESNAHGPNEFLHLPTGKKLTACVAQVIADQYTKSYND